MQCDLEFKYVTPQPACPSAPHLGPIWATSWDPYGQPRWARCPFGRGLHIRPKWVAHILAYMVLLWAPIGQPIWAANMGPTWAAQMGSMSIWPRAPRPPQMGGPQISLYGIIM